MKKSMIFVGMLAVGFANAQTEYNGKVGINTETPSATLNVKSKTGTDNTTKALEIQNGADTKLVTVLDNGNVGIGTENPLVDLHIEGKEGQNSEFMLRRFNDNTNGANLTFLKARGSATNPVIPKTGDALARFRAGGYSGNTQVSQDGFEGFSSQIVTTVAGDPNTNGTLPSHMTFLVTNKSGGRSTLLKLQSDSGVGVGFSVSEDIKARLHINDWNDVTLSSTKNALQIGRDNTANLVMDANEIMARNNGQSSGLSLQAQGGDLFINNEDTDTTKRLYFRSNTGNLGLGSANPSEKLEVKGAIKIANTSSTCTPTNVGTIKFENDNFYGCKSTGWVQLNN